MIRAFSVFLLSCAIANAVGQERFNNKGFGKAFQAVGDSVNVAPYELRPLTILQAPEVQKALGLSASQKKKIRDLIDLGRSRAAILSGLGVEDLNEFANLSDKRIDEIAREAKVRSTAIRQQNNEATTAILRPKQYERLKQIYFQELLVRRSAQLLRGKLDVELDLTEAERQLVFSEIRSAQSEIKRRMRAVALEVYSEKCAQRWAISAWTS